MISYMELETKTLSMWNIDKAIGIVFFFFGLMKWSLFCVHFKIPSNELNTVHWMDFASNTVYILYNVLTMSGK